VEVANTIIFEGAAGFAHILALIMTVIMIIHVRSKFTAVGMYIRRWCAMDGIDVEANDIAQVARRSRPSSTPTPSSPSVLSSLTAVSYRQPPRPTLTSSLLSAASPLRLASA